MPGLLCGVIAAVAGGCASGPVNPSFPITSAEAQQAVAAMRANPKPLTRPLVIVGGFLDPKMSSAMEEHFFAKIASNATIVEVSLASCANFTDCRAEILRAVNAVVPSGDPQWTAEVDVLGISLGGLAARYAEAPAGPDEPPQRLKIARLFTMSSPLSGAMLAGDISLTPLQRDMRPGSAFLAALDQADTPERYPVYAYVLLDDKIVGAHYASIPGVNPWWLANNTIWPGHLVIMDDDRVRADIARRLRGEESFSLSPPAPLP